MRLGGGGKGDEADTEPGTPSALEAADGDGDEISVGEQLFAVLRAMMAEIDDGTKLRLVGALTGTVDYLDLPDELVDVFEAAGEALYEDDEDDADDGDGGEKNQGG